MNSRTSQTPELKSDGCSRGGKRTTLAHFASRFARIISCACSLGARSETRHAPLWGRQACLARAYADGGWPCGLKRSLFYRAWSAGDARDVRPTGRGCEAWIRTDTTFYPHKQRRPWPRARSGRGTAAPRHGWRRQRSWWRCWRARGLHSSGPRSRTGKRATRAGAVGYAAGRLHAYTLRPPDEALAHAHLDLHPSPLGQSARPVRSTAARPTSPRRITARRPGLPRTARPTPRPAGR